MISFRREAATVRNWWLFRHLLDREQVGIVRLRAGRLKPAIGQASRAGCSAAPAHEAIVGRFNLAALAQIRGGDVARAELLCRKALWLCRAVIGDGGPATWAAGMIEPYINLGRIAALRGETERALAIYDDVHALGTLARPVVVDGFEVRPAAPDLRGPTIRVAESFRALMLAGEPRRAWDFIRACGGQRDELQPFIPEFDRRIAELQCLAAMRVGRACEARELALELERTATDAWSRAGSAVLAAEAASAEGDRCAADAAWKRATISLPRRAGATDGRMPYLLVRIALGRISAGVDVPVAALARRALIGAEAVGDEVQALRCLTMLSALESVDRRSTVWRDRLAARALHTHYRLERAVAWSEWARRLDEAGGDGSCASVESYVLASSIGSIEGRTMACLLAARRFGSVAAAEARAAAHRERVLRSVRVPELELEFDHLMGYSPAAVAAEATPVLRRALS